MQNEKFSTKLIVLFVIVCKTASFYSMVCQTIANKTKHQPLGDGLVKSLPGEGMVFFGLHYIYPYYDA